MIQLCNVIPASCIDRTLQIINPCDNTPVPKHVGTVLLPSRLVPEFTWASAALSTDIFANGYDFAVDVKNATLDAVVSDIRAMLIQNKFQFSTIETSKINPVPVNVATCSTIPSIVGSAKYRGISFQQKQFANTIKTISVSRLAIYAKQQYLGFTFFVNSYNYLTGQMYSRSYTVDLEIGYNDLLTLADLGTPYYEDGIYRLDVFFDNSLYPNICSTQLGQTTASGCCSGIGTYANYYAKDRCLSLYALTGVNTTQGSQTQVMPTAASNNAYGFAFDANCLCSIETLICRIATKDPKALLPLVTNKFGQLFCEAVTNSGRMNCFVLLSKEKYDEKAKEYESRYNAAYNILLQGAKNYFSNIDKQCLSCVENIKLSSNF